MVEWKAYFFLFKLEKTQLFLIYTDYTVGDCSHEIKRHLLLERKAMINPVY